MSISGGAVVAGGNMGRSHLYLGENRVYYPPPLRKYREEQEHEEEQRSTLSENRPGSSSDCSVSSSGTTCDVSNLCRFLEHTTPHVPAQYCRSRECDSESSRETSRDSSNGCSDEKRTKSVHGTWNQPNSSDASNHSSKRVSLRSKPSTSDETESSNPPGQLIFEYFEHEIPYNREPLADKIADLACQFPELKTYRSCDLSPANWLKASVWDLDEVSEGQKADSLLRAADNFQFASSL
ncbi:uncharacterized protein LOC114385831 [Glycine soja]|uniref:uncharacterized protein n=1 Tax=Glycine max TaxID=3847 RepID=UPI000719185E|nr:uncharacterized protein LOC102660476 [Glycine max]XP_028201696.1 uncharacterized protein LOC114385831 [Glycine soja]|eukprot:XP_014623114.1 uncharacterized protein LOC102660476 [Glycine max]